jgi:hypothetical protein
MFTKKISIIYLTKDKLKLAVIKLGKNPKILKSDETDWNKDSLAESFRQAKKQLKTKSIRLLLADDLSYVLQLNIPFDTKTSDERKLVEAKIKSEIPEILESEDWDFKETGRKTQKDKQIIAFAPVKSSFSLISQASVDAGLKIEAIEPEVVSKIRNENALIGLALKTDLKGKDEKVLNLKLKKLLPAKKDKDPMPPKSQPEPDTTPKKDGPLLEKESSESEKPPPPMTGSDLVTQPKPKINKTYLIIFLTTLVLGALITGGILVQRNALESRPSPTPTPLTIPSPEPSPSPTPSPSPEPEIVLSDYKVQSLNGTGGKGVAGAVKDILEAEGFENIKADNANELNHVDSTVQLKANTPDDVWNVIERALNSDYDLVKSETPLAEDSVYDVIITVGELVEESE